MITVSGYLTEPIKDISIKILINDIINNINNIEKELDKGDKDPYHIYITVYDADNDELWDTLYALDIDTDTLHKLEREFFRELGENIINNLKNNDHEIARYITYKDDGKYYYEAELNMDWYNEATEFLNKKFKSD